MTDITFRTFRNADPPQILRLWNQCGLGRGAARPQLADAFETINYAQPYFEHAGLIVAECNRQIIGFVHAGFGFTEDRSALDPLIGVICAVVVFPDFRRRGIGRELVRQAESYLQERGAQRIQAGESRSRDPFYYGLYGGSRPSGFLDSDPLAAPFFVNLGYQQRETIGVYQRDLTVKRDPVSARLQGLRRTTELIVCDGPTDPTYWWYTHLGRFDSLRFRLVDRKSQRPLAAVSVIVLEQYASVWNEQAIGLVDVFVAEDQRGCGYGQTLLIETVRRVRQDLISRVDMHVPDSRVELTGAVQAAGFQRIETGTVYEKTV
ncbi:MAG: GNAT family N-acetyltransferase [Planctomycetaceae bacterium]